MQEEKERKKIGGWPAEAFLVYDDSLRDIRAPFYDWLREEGFSFGGYHGSYGLRWVFINITRKQYAYGMPGIKVVQPIGNHAVTLDEFMAIYNIYKKYEGKSPLVFD